MIEYGERERMALRRWQTAWWRNWGWRGGRRIVDRKEGARKNEGIEGSGKPDSKKIQEQQVSGWPRVGEEQHMHRGELSGGRRCEESGRRGHRRGKGRGADICYRRRCETEPQACLRPKEEGAERQRSLQRRSEVKPWGKKSGRKRYERRQWQATTTWPSQTGAS